jgi:hypothetical protein
VRRWQRERTVGRVGLIGRPPHRLPRTAALARRNARMPPCLHTAFGARIIRALAEGAHDSARKTEIPAMSSLFISTID